MLKLMGKNGSFCLHVTVPLTVTSYGTIKLDTRREKVTLKAT